MKYLSISIVTLVFVLSLGAHTASALSVSEQIQSLLAQVATLQERIRAISTGSSSIAPSPAISSSSEAPATCKVWYDGCNTCSRQSVGSPLACTMMYCFQNAGASCREYFGNGSDGLGSSLCSLSSNPILSRGSRGAVVSLLQQLLNDEGFLTVSPTGYFGQATEVALKAWQASEGVVNYGSPATTGWGTLGPRSWEMLRKYCGGGVPGGSLSAYPTHGQAPLTVTFSAEGYANSWTDGMGHTVAVADRGTRYLDFGDGSGTQQIICSGATASTCRATIPHVYLMPGTYTATLFTAGYYGPQNDTTYGTRTNVATQTITVFGGTSVCTADYTPVCGRPSGCANSCPPGAMCPMYCMLQQPKTYSNRCLLDAAGAEFLYNGACTTSGTNNPPTISGVSGPTSLSVNEVGTWSVQANDPENQTLSYSVSWGDEYGYPMMMDAAVSSPTYSQTSTFTHQYRSAGTYTVRVTVTDSGGQSATTSITVRVGNPPVACTMEYAPVCGQKTVCPACTSNYPACMAPCSVQYQTYSNQCMLGVDGATFVHSGTCTSSYLP